MADRPIRCGLLGPGRTRDGLGPFLARHLERAGLLVVAGAGRDMARTRAATTALGAELGHEVDARDGIAGLLAPGDLDVLVIASPASTHFAALDAAADARLHVLCEKPLVTVDATDRLPLLIERFVAAGRVLVENCQWPFSLPEFDELYPNGRAVVSPPQVFEMRLSPSQTGPAMLLDSLSHFLSMLQALAPVDVSTELTRCEVTDGTESTGLAAKRVVLEFARPFKPLTGRLELVECPHQPRPAWYAIDGLRLDREIRMPGYEMHARGEHGRSVRMDDPLGQLVYRFAQTVREPHDRTQREADRILHRARLFRAVVDACAGSPS